MELQVNCPKCKRNILSSDYFCPNCGKKIKDKPLSVTVGRQILVYLLSFLLPPLGLWPAVKYLKQKDEKSRIIGFVAITITIISIAITVWFTLSFLDTFNRQLNSSLNLYRLQ